MHIVPRLPRKSHRGAVHIVLRLPRKSHRQSGGDEGTPGRTFDPLQSTKCRASHAKATAERRRPRDARAYIRPLAEHQEPRLPRKSHRQSGGDQGMPGRTSDPLQSTKCRTCHAKATGRAAETKGRQSVHPTPCRAPTCRTCHRRATSSGDPLQSTECRTRTCHAKATGRAAETKGRQGVNPTPCRAGYGSPCACGPTVGARDMGSRIRGPWGARRAHEARRAREAREPEFEIIQVPSLIEPLELPAA